MIDIVLVLVHKLVDHKGVPVVRVVAFEAYDDSGARQVYDILEANQDSPNGLRWLAQMTENYGAPVVMENDEGTRPLDEIDTGRARKVSSRVLRALETL